MERKTKHRILGIIVMAALVIALLPLFHGSNNETKPDPQATMAPPFPDQSAQVSDNANPEFKMALANQTSPIPFQNSQDDNGINQLPDDTINPNNSKAYNNFNKSAPAQSPSKPVSKPVAIEDEVNDIQTPLASPDDDVPGNQAIKEDAPTAAQKSAPTTESIFRNSLESEFKAEPKSTAKRASHTFKVREFTSTKIKQAKHKKHAPLDENGLFKLKNSAWVIQLGSYKNKAAALRVVNRLRANGYSAFIQQASTGTSVYVGPEMKEKIARSIATRLEYEMKLQGFVISYKPLTL